MERALKGIEDEVVNTITLKVQVARETVQVEMPAATSGLYAAKRIAEEVGWDPDLYWVLSSRIDTPMPIDQQAPIVELGGQRLWLLLAVKGEDISE